MTRNHTRKNKFKNTQPFSISSENLVEGVVYETSGANIHLKINGQVWNRRFGQLYTVRPGSLETKKFRIHGDQGLIGDQALIKDQLLQ